MNVHLALTQADCGIEAGKAPEANYERRQRRSWTKFPILLFEQPLEFRVHRLQRIRISAHGKPRNPFGHRAVHTAVRDNRQMPDKPLPSRSRDG